MLVNEPVPVIAPGFIVQFISGKPVNSILPVVIVQEGCVIRLTIGAVGEPGAARMITSVETGEMHPSELVTV